MAAMMCRMIVRLISAESDLRLLLRSTRNGDGEWGEIRFSTTTETCDACVVFESLPFEVELNCPPRRLVFFSGEPPEVKEYEPAFLAQFTRVVGSNDLLSHPGLVLGACGTPWHLGASQEFLPGPEQLIEMGSRSKPKTLSVICSDKMFTKGHRRRLEYVLALKEQLGGLLEVFGRGIRPFSDKIEAIAPFRYHIAMENCVRPNYWTEKIADSYLGGAFPFYLGAPDLDRYFPEESFVALPSGDPVAAARLIRAEIARDRAVISADAMAEARRRLCEKHHFPAMVAELVNGLGGSGVRERIRLHPERPRRLGWGRRLRERLDWAGRRRAGVALLKLTGLASRG